jgi:probable phosphoglycerate mutase
MIVLVRHGETAGNLQRVLQVADTPLNDTGLTQAERLAERIAGLRPALILCSDLLRARMTARPIALRSGAAVEFSALLQERNFGDVRGTPYAALAFDPFAPDYVPPGGESWEVFYRRAARAFELIAERRRALTGALVVVTHGLMCGALLRQQVALDAGLTIPERFDNTGVTVLDPEPPHRARLINCCAHLTSRAPAADAGGRA